MRKLIMLPVIALFIICSPLSLVYAENPLTPDKLAGAKIISAEECKKLLAGKAKVFDVRNELEYSEGHVPGAVGLPYKEKSEKSVNFDPGVDKLDLSKLPGDKNTPIIFYCNGERCWKSYKSSVAAMKAGYKNVHWFRGGIPEWTAKGFPIEK
ncbi:MAG: rhodanese-like domain-containing protein [Nitrospirae bacterium]|nr:rhodanese-like domain-containing protein [Nitrospirota bacterium]